MSYAEAKRRLDLRDYLQRTPVSEWTETDCQDALWLIGEYQGLWLRGSERHAIAVREMHEHNQRILEAELEASRE